MIRRANPIGLAVTAGVLLCAEWALAGPPSSNWLPDAALLPRLSSVVTLGPYQIQPPIGYVPMTQRAPSGVNAQSWVGKTREDGTRPYVMFTQMTPPADETTTYVLDEVSAKVVAAIHKRRTDWKQTRAEAGSVNNLAFLRTYWRGTDIATGAPMYGFVYVAVDGGTYLELSSQDVEPYWKNSMPLAEASVLTFKKIDSHPQANGSETPPVTGAR